MKKKLSLLLVLMMIIVAVFASCGDDKDKDDRDDDDDKKGSGISLNKKDDDEDEDEGEFDIVGDWEAEMDFGSIVNDIMMASDEEMAEYFDFDGLAVVFDFEFKKNGKCSMEADEDSVEDMLADLEDIMLEGLEKYLVSLGISEDEIDTYMDQLADEMIDAMYSEFDPSDLTGISEDGEYEFDGEELTIDDEAVDFEIKGANKFVIIIEQDGIELELVLNRV